MAPQLAGEAGASASWADVKLLSVEVNRLTQRRREGPLFIGDAAYALSPTGGVGMNLEVEDAVAAARIPGTPLSEGRLTTEQLAAVQKHRARMTQSAQVLAQRMVLIPAPRAKTKISPPFVLRLRRQLPARAVDLGLRPELWDTALDWPPV